MPLANVALTDTFDIWRIRTNQLIYLAEGANDSVSFANTVAQQAFDKANSANLLALSTGIISNAFTSATISGANTSVGAGANAFTSATIAGANTYLISIIAGSNTAVGAGANAFAAATIAGANAHTNTLIAASFGQANTANIRAVAAFEKANSIVIAINEDTVDETRYVAFINNTTGNVSTINVSSTGLFFNPSTRTLTANNISIPFSLGIGTAPSGTVGEIRATSDITAYYSSDISLKENISVIPNALNKLMNIRGVSFDWNQSYIDERGGEDGYFVRKKDVGIIAQEVEKILPEVVATRDNGIKAVKYEKLIALLIEAIKELNTKIENK
jgi:hypothetical protein